LLPVARVPIRVPTVSGRGLTGHPAGIDHGAQIRVAGLDRRVTPARPRSPTPWPSTRSAGPRSRSSSAKRVRWPKSGSTGTSPPRGNGPPPNPPPRPGPRPPIRCSSARPTGTSPPWRRSGPGPAAPASTSPTAAASARRSGLPGGPRANRSRRMLFAARDSSQHSSPIPAPISGGMRCQGPTALRAVAHVHGASRPAKAREQRSDVPRSQTVNALAGEIRTLAQTLVLQICPVCHPLPAAPVAQDLARELAHSLAQGVARQPARRDNRRSCDWARLN
jgi:hypothetical protein